MGKMRVNVSFGRFGALFLCATCGGLVEHTNLFGVLAHVEPRKPWFREPGPRCPFVGKTFRDPYENIELEEVPTLRNDL